MLKAPLLAATLFFAAIGAQAQTFGEFLNKPELPLTCMGVDFSATCYYGPTTTASLKELKSEFARINQLLVDEADKYNLGKALNRNSPTIFAIQLAESVNARIDTAAIVAPSTKPSRPNFTIQTVEGMLKNYTYPAGSSGVGLVFIVETINKRSESEVFWATFVDLATKRMLFTQRISGTGSGFGFRNHWATPLHAGIKEMKNHYGDWKKKFSGK